MHVEVKFTEEETAHLADNLQLPAHNTHLTKYLAEVLHQHAMSMADADPNITTHSFAVTKEEEQLLAHTFAPGDYGRSWQERVLDLALHIALRDAAREELSSREDDLNVRLRAFGLVESA